MLMFNTLTSTTARGRPDVGDYEKGGLAVSPNISPILST